MLSRFLTWNALATATLPLAQLAAHSVKVTDIQGPAFQSPLAGQVVTNLTALVTAKGKSGFWIAGDRVHDERVSNGLSVFTSSATILNSVHVGDIISLSGKVQEFRSASSPNDLFLTELASPSNITVLSSNNIVTPLILGVDRSPPTQLLSALDVGGDGFLSVPNNLSLVEKVNATLHPRKYGLDFWESLEGQLVTVREPVALDFQNSFGEFWVRGDWPTTGVNGRGGITITFGPHGIPDANPETVIVGAPLDGTKNPKVAVGQTFSDITGVIHFQFGFYYILPTTAPVLLSSPDPNVPPTRLEPADDPCIITFGDYKVENLAPKTDHLPTVASHIALQLKTPDLMFIQEIQDNSGPTDDGTVDANLTLTTLVNSIANATGGAVKYAFLDISPEDNQDGGQPGGNIRQAYLYRPEKIALAGNTVAGSALDNTAVEVESGGQLGLTFNPGRIDPTNVAWNESRKPLVAVWQSTLPESTGERFFTINLHLTSKTGSSSTAGDARPFVNEGVDQRTAQVNTVSTFVKSILAHDKQANIITAGDCNEFLQTRSVFSAFSHILTDADEVAGIAPVERYTYVFDQNTQQIDHIFVSNALKKRGVEVEHVHVNNWASSLNLRASDHDPSVARVNICKVKRKRPHGV
ncbi:DNase I-like protein [Rickenella mellea]|uniref:DNase I-like protein n=1 Tax=Rickenella mellea TaxID=50990 RepID=A0A4Y7Q4L8_9AGAM|nr:DNase I-like protein [Rickenella mellea]